MPGVLDPYTSLLFKSPPEYLNCDNAAPSDVIWNTIDGRSGYPIWKPCTYNSRIDYRIPGGGNYTIQDWSNPDQVRIQCLMMNLPVDLTIGKNIQFLGHYAPLDGIVINLFLLCCLIWLKAELFGNQKFGGPLPLLPLLP